VKTSPLRVILEFFYKKKNSRVYYIFRRKVVVTHLFVLGDKCDPFYLLLVIGSL
jgi:hypothetical protein